MPTARTAADNPMARIFHTGVPSHRPLSGPGIPRTMAAGMSGPVSWGEKAL